MKTLVIGCTGTVGSYVLQGLMMHDEVVVRCMSHTRHDVKNFPRAPEGYMADLDKPDTLAGAFDGVDSLFLVVPVGRNETVRGLNAVEAAKAAGIKRIVYLSVYMPHGSAIIPHFSSKIPVENAIRQSGIPYTILRPNNFFQNDVPVIGIITSYGVYPTPIGLIGMNRIDVRDVAECAVNAIVQSGHEAIVYSLHGPDTLNGNDMARIYSRYVGRDVRYGGNNLDTWAGQVRNVIPEWQYRDFGIMFKYFQEHGMIAPEGDLERQQILLGHPPRSFEEFAQEITNEWKRSLACAA